MKKYNKFILPVLLLLVSAPLVAAEPEAKFDGTITLTTIVADFGNTLLYILLGISLLMLLLVTAVYYSVIGLRDKIMAEHDPAYLPKANQSLWGRIFQVSHTSTDKDVALDHNYDGIQELNNPIPGWFMWLFYGTAVFAVVYLLNYHVFKSSKLQYEEYETELIEADIAYQAYLKKAGDKINAETVTLLTDKTEIAKGGELFAINKCEQCHGKNAEGNNIGPNLTDEFWIHGGGIKNVFKTISEGVQVKGMKAWKKDFSPMQIQQIASYVLSLQGSNPAGGKEPQGPKWIEGQTPAQDSATQKQDSAAVLPQTSMK